MPIKYWLMKAEPDSRVVKGKDVKFSVDDFESMKVTPWEGVRSHEAKNLMKEMQVGDKVLFYHSNCKNPGIAGFAEVSREAYPDYTAWDETHPYFHAKSDPANPTWYMVDLKFTSRATHFVPLSVLRRISLLTNAPPGVEYIGSDGVAAIKSMPLVTRGRLSVQRLDEEALQQSIGLDSRMKLTDGKGQKRVKQKAKVEANGDEDDGEGGSHTAGDGTGMARLQKRKAKDTGSMQDVQGLRRSRRAKNWE